MVRARASAPRRRVCACSPQAPPPVRGGSGGRGLGRRAAAAAMHDVGGARACVRACVGVRVWRHCVRSPLGRRSVVARSPLGIRRRTHALSAGRDGRLPARGSRAQLHDRPPCSARGRRSLRWTRGTCAAASSPHSPSADGGSAGPVRRLRGGRRSRRLRSPTSDRPWPACPAHALAACVHDKAALRHHRSKQPTASPSSPPYSSALSHDLSDRKESGTGAPDMTEDAAVATDRIGNAPGHA